MGHQTITSSSVSELRALMDTDADLSSFREKLNKIGGIDGLCAELNTSSTHGLADDASVSRNRQIYGENTNAGTKMGHSETQSQIPGCCSLLWRAWGQRDLVINRIAFYIRITPAILAIVFGILFHFTSSYEDEFGDGGIMLWMWLFYLIDPVAYWLTCLLLVRKSNLIAIKNSAKVLLGYKTAIGVAVTRNGVDIKELPLSELVVGDICQLNQSGSIISGDGILLAGIETEDPRLFAGEFYKGQEKMLVLAVGENTRAAKTVNPTLISSQKPNSALDEQLYTFYRLAIKCALIFATVTTALLFLRFCVEKYAIQKEVWSMAHLQRIVSFIATGIYLIVWALPEIIPPAVILSQIRNLRKARDDGILLKNIGVQSKIPSITVILIDEGCVGLIKLIDENLSAIQNICRQGIRVKILVEAARPAKLHDSILNDCGINSDDRIYFNSVSNPKSNVVESMKNSGETVGYLAIGLQSDIQALRTAYVGIILGSAQALATKDALESADVYIPHPSSDKSTKPLEKLFTERLAIYLIIYSIFQLRLPGLITLCVVKFILTVMVSSAFSAPQTLWVYTVDVFLILGLVYSDDVEDSNPSKSSASATLFPRHILKNILFQIIYQSIVVIVLTFNSDYGDPSLVFDSIIWMTLFNAFNSRKGLGETNVFSGLTFKQSFLWIWISCAICQIVIAEFGGSFFYPVTLGFVNAVLCFALGIGTLLVYQISIRIPFWKEAETQEVGVAYKAEGIPLV